MNVQDADFNVADFKFDDGGQLPNLRLHYKTLGTPARDAQGKITNAVLLLHGTAASSEQFLMPSMAKPLFESGKPLDVEKSFIIIPDCLVWKVKQAE